MILRKISLGLASSLLISVPAMADVTTEISVYNKTNDTQYLRSIITRSRTLDYIEPVLMSWSTAHAVDHSSGDTNGGTIDYGACKFYWETEKHGRNHSFSASAQNMVSNYKCSAKTSVSNSTTGEYSVKFYIEQN